MPLPPFHLYSHHGEPAAVFTRPCRYAEIIRPLDNPIHPEGGIAVLKGNLAPWGAVIKPRAASPYLLKHKGRAVVFSSLADLEARIDDPNLDVRPFGAPERRPHEAPGMPEAGMLPIPKKLLAQGVRDMVRISDCRMSGTAFGTVVLHVAPESAAGGPLACVRDGDLIELDVPNRRLELQVDPAELARRQAEWQPPAIRGRGYTWLYQKHVLQADEGCDFDFLVKQFDGQPARE